MTRGCINTFFRLFVALVTLTGLGEGGRGGEGRGEGREGELEGRRQVVRAHESQTQKWVKGRAEGKGEGG